jgi:hypothetical protein
MYAVVVVMLDQSRLGNHRIGYVRSLSFLARRINTRSTRGFPDAEEDYTEDE